VLLILEVKLVKLIFGGEIINLLLTQVHLSFTLTY